MMPPPNPPKHVPGTEGHNFTDGISTEAIFTETVEELFNRAPCGYLSLRPDGTVVRANQTFLEWTGHSRDTLLAGTRFRNLLTVPGRIYFETHFGPLLQMQGAIKEVAFDLLRPGQTPLSVTVNAIAERSADGQLLLIRVAIFDATDRRRYERELLLARRRAEEAIIAERNARELAEQANRVKDEFLALVSHELRTPLNAILGWSQILRRSRNADADLLDGLSVIERNTKVQVQLVDDLLDMGRIASGKMRLEVQRVDLAAVVKAAVETARPAAEARSIRLQTVLDPTVAVSGDPGRLQQIFWNLLANAIKFTPKEGSIRVEMERVNSHIEVRFIDSGQGMKPEFIPHVFERFRQSDSAATQKTGGLGLGLSLVKHLAEIHGGSVSASSPGEGKGSTFVVHLPLRAVESPSEEESRVHPRPGLMDGAIDVSGITLAGVRVLVVDDERDAREIVRRVLANAHAEVATAASAAEALETVLRFVPHVLGSDVGMPGEDGYDLIRRIRMLGGENGGLKAVALTAFSRMEDRTKAMLAGFQMYLAKPIEPAELVVTVASLAGRVHPGSR